MIVHGGGLMSVMMSFHCCVLVKDCENGGACVDIYEEVELCDGTCCVCGSKCVCLGFSF